MEGDRTTVNFTTRVEFARQASRRAQSSSVTSVERVDDDVGRRQIVADEVAGLHGDDPDPGRARREDAGRRVLDDDRPRGRRAELRQAREVRLRRRFAVRVVLGGDDDREELAHADAAERVAHLLAAGARDDRQLRAARQPPHQRHRARQRAVAGLGEERVLLRDGRVDELAHRDGERVVARDHLVDLVPGVADDEAALLVGQLGAVAPHRQHHRLDVLPLAVDQRPVEIEQKRFGRRTKKIHERA